MAIQITLPGAIVLLFNGYTLSVKTEREMFERLLLLLQEYDGPMFVVGDFNYTLEPRLNRAFVSPSRRHDSLAFRWLLGRSQLSDVLDADMEIFEAERALPAFQAADHTYFYTLPGGASASSQLYRWYVSPWHDDWIRDIDISVPGPAADHNGIGIRSACHVIRSVFERRGACIRFMVGTCGRTQNKHCGYRNGTDLSGREHFCSGVGLYHVPEPGRLVG